MIIPAHNEESNIVSTCRLIVEKFRSNRIHDFEILMVNDSSTDMTEVRMKELCAADDCMRYVNNSPPKGFGLAIQKGLKHYHGQAACIVMADMSDSPDDILVYYQKIKKGAEAVFGSRFIKGSKVIDYPVPKLLLNRLANLFIRLLFNIGHNDITNAFKCYRREVVDGIQPILSHHFNITVELPLKAIVRGYRYETVPISWRNRVQGISKLKIKEMGSRYLFIILYAYIEKLLSKGDYHRRRHIDGSTTSS